jgi:hypothetical protein
LLSDQCRLLFPQQLYSQSPWEEMKLVIDFFQVIFKVSFPLLLGCCNFQFCVWKLLGKSKK